MKRFELDEVQADAILEMRLYQLARLEIEKILDERGGEEEAPEGDRGAAREPKRALEAHPRGARRARREVRRRAPHALRGRRRARVRRRGLHRPRGRDRGPHARRLDEARARGEGPDRRRGCARATRSPPSCRARRATAWSLFSTPRHALRAARRRRAGDDRLRRAGAVAPQVRRRRARRGRAPRARGGAPAAGARQALARARGDATPRCSSRPRSGYGFRATPDLSETTRAGRRLARVGEGDEIVSRRAGRWARSSSSRRRAGKMLRFALDEVAELSGPGRGVILMKPSTRRTTASSARSRCRRTATFLAVTPEGGERKLARRRRAGGPARAARARRS